MPDHEPLASTKVPAAELFAVVAWAGLAQACFRNNFYARPLRRLHRRAWNRRASKRKRKAGRERRHKDRPWIAHTS